MITNELKGLYAFVYDVGTKKGFDPNVGMRLNTDGKTVRLASALDALTLERQVAKVVKGDLMNYKGEEEYLTLFSVMEGGRISGEIPELGLVISVFLTKINLGIGGIPNLMTDQEDQ
jgi:hypothetical protein